MVEMIIVGKLRWTMNHFEALVFETMGVWEATCVFLILCWIQSVEVESLRDWQVV